jgi:hypothetical protein
MHFSRMVKSQREVQRDYRLRKSEHLKEKERARGRLKREKLSTEIKAKASDQARLPMQRMREKRKLSTA